MGRLINSDELIGCAIIRPMTHEDFEHIHACKNLVNHNALHTAYNVEAVVENVYEIGRRFCNSVKCNKECQDCDHGVLIKAIVSEIRNGGVK